MGIAKNDPGYHIQSMSIKINEQEYELEPYYGDLVEPLSYEGLNLKAHVKFVDPEDAIGFVITLVNTSNKTYEIENIKNFHNDDHMEYYYQFSDDNNIIHPDEEKQMYIRITYKENVEEDQFEDGIYSFNNVMQLSLSSDDDDDEDILNPNTGTGKVFLIFISSLIILIVGLGVIKQKKKAYLFLLLLLIPIGLKAYQKVYVKVETEIEIRKQYNYAIIDGRCHSQFPNSSFAFDQGMTLKQHRNSVYYHSSSGTFKDEIDFLFDYLMMLEEGTIDTLDYRIVFVDNDGNKRDISPDEKISKQEEGYYEINSTYGCGSF